MGFISEGNNRLIEDANCRNKEIQHRAELFRVLSKIFYGLDYSVMIVLHVDASHEYCNIDL
jgi:hypothetical protein